MKSVIVKTAQSEVKQDSNGKNYRTVEFSELDFEMVDMGGGNAIQVKREARKTSINRYEESYLPTAKGAAEIGYHEAVGTKFLGEIVTREVETPYEIDERMQHTFTTVVFGDSENPNWETKVRQSFRSKNHPVKGDVQIATPQVQLVK